MNRSSANDNHIKMSGSAEIVSLVTHDEGNLLSSASAHVIHAKC
jgi:hypothetical protein